MDGMGGERALLFSLQMTWNRTMGGRQSLIYFFQLDGKRCAAYLLLV